MNHSLSGGGRPAAMGPPPGLARYGSAPGSFLAGIADSVMASSGGSGSGSERSPASAGSERMMTRFFTGDSHCLTSESSYRSPEGDATAGSPLVRHSSLPSAFFSHQLADQGLSSARMIGNYSQAGTENLHVLAHRRQRAQWGFSRQDSLSQISELSIPEVEESDTYHDSDEAAGNASQSYISSNFQLGSWDDTNSITFSAPQSKRIKCNNEDIVASLGDIHSQFSLPRTSSELSELEKYVQIQQDSVPCRVRAKRGCATHPRSIAERERRTRISKRLRKLQDLVPNMDKQTSTSDMLELAIQHIKELQSQVQNLKQEQTNCTCTSKQEKA
ncbi:transcription factor bHLH128-like isoform X2 [Zingiber officinale]|uniref:transcription factor bHLH128-like isoform X2 n=1 Tax=Zingiber officinale TaxID=94328 RepID=UPI001C4AB587|nr:transcription factor bHLH128-like isoform X2 [Zingiber officinale]